MDHREARTHLIDRRRGTLDAASRAALETHLAGGEEGGARVEAGRGALGDAPLEDHRAGLIRARKASWVPPSPHSISNRPSRRCPIQATATMSAPPAMRAAAFRRLH